MIKFKNSFYSKSENQKKVHESYSINILQLVWLHKILYLQTSTVCNLKLPSYARSFVIHAWL